MNDESVCSILISTSKLFGGTQASMLANYLITHNPFKGYNRVAAERERERGKFYLLLVPLTTFCFVRVGVFKSVYVCAQIGALINSPRG